MVGRRDFREIDFSNNILTYLCVSTWIIYTDAPELQIYYPCKTGCLHRLEYRKNLDPWWLKLVRMVVLHIMSRHVPRWCLPIDVSSAAGMIEFWPRFGNFLEVLWSGQVRDHSTWLQQLPMLNQLQIQQRRYYLLVSTDLPWTLHMWRLEWMR